VRGSRQNHDKTVNDGKKFERVSRGDVGYHGYFTEFGNEREKIKSKKYEQSKQN